MRDCPLEENCRAFGIFLVQTSGDVEEPPEQK